MSFLILGKKERDAIAEVVKQAKERPIPFEVMKDVGVQNETPTLDLKDIDEAKRDKFLQEYPPYELTLGTYRASFTFEYQPGGLFRHLSVSSRRKGKVPGMEVMRMIMEEFGFSGFPPKRPARLWTEEFEPGWHAVNVVEMEQL